MPMKIGSNPWKSNILLLQLALVLRSKRSLKFRIITICWSSKGLRRERLLLLLCWKQWMSVGSVSIWGTQPISTNTPTWRETTYSIIIIADKSQRFLSFKWTRALHSNRLILISQWARKLVNGHITVKWKVASKLILRLIEASRILEETRNPVVQ